MVHGNSDADTFASGTGNDTIFGGSGTNTFYAGGTNGLPKKIGTDTFIGGSAGNTFFLGDGAANVTGGTIAAGSTGTNTVDFGWATSAVVINLATGINGGAAAQDTLTNIQSIIGSNFGDTISAWGGKVLLGGTATTNTLDYSSAPAAVKVDFSQGTAQVGTLAQDSISAFQRVIGSAGDDDFIDGAGLSYVDGAGGYNTLDFFGNPNGISLNLAAGTGTSGFGTAMTIKNIQIVYGSLYHPNTIIGANDTQNIFGSMYGGDKITANSANTQVSFATSAAAVTVNLTTGVNTGGGAQGDVLTNVDQIQGSNYNDTLTGNGSYSGLDGYLGNDTLIGGGGYDVYYFAEGAGYGQDVVFNGTGSGAASGEIVMGYAPSNVWLSQSGNDLVVQILGTTSQVTVKNWFTSTSAQLQRMVAGDGSQIGTSAIGQLETAMASYQASNPTFNPKTATVMPASLTSNVTSLWGSGVATGTSGNDTLDPGVGNTTLVGNGGSDVYEFRAGYGADVIINGVTTNTGPTGELLLSAGLDPGNLWFTRSGNDLVIQVLNAPTQMTVRGWFANGTSQLQSLMLADGSQIGTAAIAALATAMTAFQTSSGFNAQAATAMPTAAAVQTALATNWSRVITGATSNTTLNGIHGSDTLITSGSGNTLIGGSGLSTLVSNAAGNTLEAGTGVAVADYVGIANLTVNLASGKARVNGATASDTLVGIASAVVSGTGDALIAGTGADTLVANGAYDTLVGNALGSTLVASQSSSVAWYAGNGETINLAAGTATRNGATLSDTLIGIARATVSGASDTLIGASGTGALSAVGSASGDTLIGVNAATTLASNGAGNTLDATSGQGLAFYTGGNMTVNLATGKASVNGSSASDTLIGITKVAAYGIHQTLIGGSGSSTLISDAAGNTLEAGTGPTTVAYYGIANLTANLATGVETQSGTTGSDTLIGITRAMVSGAGDTLIGASNTNALIATGSASGDTLLGISAATTLASNGAGNTLDATSGQGLAYYSGGNVTVNLATGKASVNGTSVSDTLIGITKVAAYGIHQTLIGGSGSSTLISDAAGNTLEAGTGSTTAAYYGIANLTVNLSTGKETQSGTTASDTLIGITNAVVSGSGNTLIAGAGTDTLSATGSSDIYQFARGDGQAIIVNGASSNTSASNELDFAAGISDQQLWFLRSGNDLQIDVMGTSSEATVAGWFTSPRSQLSEITAGGLKLDSQVSQLVQAMATYSSNNPGFNPVTASQAPSDTALQSSIAAAWHS